ncbi:MAG: 5-formyltetrahydrofolate cyclo-ligase [Rhodocyclales bacterium]|nr:5-formyltetrahydrofolate cyclo-ligase [Rhodocyclales bacterium]
MNLPPPSAEHIAESRAVRAALRRERLAARIALDDAGHATLSSRVEASLAALLDTLPAQTLAFCAPVRREFDAGPLVARLLGRGWRAAMPVVVAAEAPMVFRTWTPDAAMTVDRHGIPIPQGGAEVTPDVLLLPLVAFDARGFRLGYGAGYFDRTLAAMVPRPLAIGVGYELCRVADIHPEPQDIALDVLVTEAGVFRPGD